VTDGRQDADVAKNCQIKLNNRINDFCGKAAAESRMLETCVRRTISVGRQSFHTSVSIWKCRRSFFVKQRLTGLRGEAYKARLRGELRTGFWPTTSWRPGFSADFFGSFFDRLNQRKGCVGGDGRRAFVGVSALADVR
jgi:hypothetical protein